MEESEKNLDINKIKNAFNKILNKTLIIIFCIVLSLSLSIYYRSYTASLPGVYIWAENSIDNQISNQIMAGIDSQYPNLPQLNKDALLEEQKVTIYKEQKDLIKQQQTQLADLFRSKMQDDYGQTYLLEIDPYQHLRRAENLENYGRLGEAVVDGRPYTYYQFAPAGKFITEELHPYMIFYSHKIVQLFNPAARMMVTEFWLPVFLSALCVIPAFFIVRKKAGMIGGLVAALIIAVNPTFLARTVAGFSDTDAYAILFPLLITWAFIEAHESNSIVKKIILSLTAGLLTGLFAFAWPAGWWYIFDLIIGTVVVYLCYNVTKHLINKEKIFNEKLKYLSLTLIIYFVISSLSVPLMSNEDLTGALTNPLMRTRTQNAAYADYWPNIQTTVAELGSIGLTGAIGQLGGKLLFGIAMIGLILSLVNINKPSGKDYAYLLLAIPYTLAFLSPKVLELPVITYILLLSVPIAAGFILSLFRREENNGLHIILLTAWILGSLFATTHGTRFLLVMIPAFALATGICFGLLQEALTKMTESFLNKKHKLISLAIISILMVVFLSGMFKQADSIARQETPLIDDAWYESLSKINKTAEPKAIVNSWWDFGHWFAYVANRPTTVDGGGQENHLAYWMGSVLISDNEEKAINTLRMLDCGSFSGYYDILNQTANDYVKSTMLIQKITQQSRQEAQKTLNEEGIGNVETVLDKVFCNPPENYLITSEDMVGKAPVWAHFGAWDFNKAYAWIERTKSPQELSEKLRISSDEAQDLFIKAQMQNDEQQANAWISPWPQYLTGSWIPCDDNNSTMTCTLNRAVGYQNDMQITIEKIIIPSDISSATIKGGIYTNAGIKRGEGDMIPNAYVFYGENKSIQKINKKDSTLQIDIVVDLVNKQVLLTSPLLSESLFTKLFYFEGRYTEHFEMFSDATALNGQRIIIWKVKWD